MAVFEFPVEFDLLYESFVDVLIDDVSVVEDKELNVSPVFIFLIPCSIERFSLSVRAENPAGSTYE